MITNSKKYEYRSKRLCRACESIIKDKNKTGYCIKHSAGRNTPVLICSFCKVNFRRSPATTKTKEVFCSTTCKGKYQSLYERGEKGRRYGKLLVTPQELAKRNKARFLYNKWRLKKKLPKQPCTACGSNKFAEAHHNNYDKPLEVEWLCKKHHYNLHKLARKEKLSLVEAFNQITKRI